MARQVSQDAVAAYSSMQGVAKELEKESHVSEHKVGMSVLRVAQLDAERLSYETWNQLKTQFRKAFVFLEASMGWELELDAILAVLLFRYTIWNNNQTYGDKLHNIIYRSDARAKLFGKFREVLLCVVSVLVPYIYSKVVKKGLDEGWGNLDGAHWKRRVHDALYQIETGIKVLSLGNLLIFIKNGEFRNIVDRLLGLRLVNHKAKMNKMSSFEFMDRQLWWNYVTEFLTFMLPFVNFLPWVRRMFRSKGAITTNYVNNYTCSICMLNPIQVPGELNCGHQFCYYCISARRAQGTTTCPVCTTLITSITRPVKRLHMNVSYDKPFKMAEPPPPPSMYFTPKPKEVLPHPPSRKIIPRPHFGPHDTPKRPASAPLKTRPRPTSPILQRTASPLTAPCTSPVFDSYESLLETKVRKPEVVETKTNAKRREVHNWKPSGFDIISAAIRRTLNKVGDVTESLDTRWVLLSNLIQQYGVEADAANKEIPLEAFYRDMKTRFDGVAVPNHTMTCTAIIVIDQLLLLLKRTFPRYGSLLMDARSVLLKSLYITPNEEKDILPFDDPDDRFEVDEQFERFSKKTYFQGARELSLRLLNDEDAFEKEELSREKQGACVNRVIDHWQTQFKVLLLKAWQQHHRHEKELKKRDAAEKNLSEQLRLAEGEVAKRDSKIEDLQTEIQRLQDNNLLEKKLKAAIQSKRQLQKELDNLSAELLENEAKKDKLNDSLVRCHNLVKDIYHSLRPQNFFEYTLQDKIEDSLIDPDDVASPVFLLELLNSVSASDQSEYTVRVESYSASRRLLDIYLHVIHILDSRVISRQALESALSLDDEERSTAVLNYGRMLGIDIMVTPPDLLVPNSKVYHMAFTSMLVARLCNPMCISLGIVSQDNCESRVSNINRTPQSTHLQFGISAASVFAVTPEHKRELITTSELIDDVATLTDVVKKIQHSMKKTWQWNSLGFSALKISLNQTLETTAGRAEPVFTLVESAMMNTFCDPQVIGYGVDAFNETGGLLMVLQENYRLLRAVFAHYADDGVMHAESTWEMLKESKVPQTFSNVTRAVFDDLVDDLNLMTSFGPSQWIAIIIHIADVALVTKLAYHEKVRWILERHILCYTAETDATEFRDTVYRSDVQEVLAEYKLHLRCIFDFYSEKKPRMSLNQYIQMLTDCNLFPTAAEQARKQLEGKMRVHVCTEIYTTFRDMSGGMGSINYSCFMEVVAGVSVYDCSAQPYITIAKAIRKFVEKRLINQLATKITSLNLLVTQHSLPQTTREYRLLAFSDPSTPKITKLDIQDPFFNSVSHRSSERTKTGPSFQAFNLTGSTDANNILAKSRTVPF